MRKLVVLILIILIILASGIFVVNERQVAIVTNIKGKTYLKARGLHYAWPIFDKVSYIYTNQKNALLNIQIESSGIDTESLQIEAITSYHVIDPLTYLKNIHKAGKAEINRKMTEFLVDQITKDIQDNGLIKFNQHDGLLDHPYSFAEAGICIDQAYLVSINIINTQRKLVESNQNASTPVTNNLSIESAYYYAQIVKNHAKIEVDTINQSMQIKDPKFYEYFNKLRTYEQEAKSKTEVPPLSKLYNQ